MRLIVYCKNCKKEIKFPYNKPDRVRMNMDYGNKFIIHCPKCENKNTFYVHEIKAKEGIGVLVSLISTIISILIIVIFWGSFLINVKWYALPIAVSIPILIFQAIVFNIKNRINLFNKS